MTYDIDKLREIKAEIDQAMGPDRALDVLIMQTLYDLKPHYHENGSGYILGMIDCSNVLIAIEPLTASLDAVKALIERVLPGYASGSERVFDGVGGFQFKAWVGAFGKPRIIESHKASEELARNSALFAALIAREEGR